MLTSTAEGSSSVPARMIFRSGVPDDSTNNVVPQFVQKRRVTSPPLSARLVKPWVMPSTDKAALGTATAVE